MAALDFKLLNDFQRDFPLVPRPFRYVAEQSFVAEAEVIERLRSLNVEGIVSRVGAVFAPGRIGASTLFALAVPPARLREVASLLDASDAINHSYEREHDYNLWAVATAPDEDDLEALLASICFDTGLPVLNLPLIEEFRIDLGFDLEGRRQLPPSRVLNGPRQPLAPRERRLIEALQCGLPLIPEPFRVLASRAGMSERSVLALLAKWIDNGVIRRFGVIVRHHELGYRANAMAVWDVPDAAVGELGRALALAPGVTLAYRRRRSLPQWPYNLFCMMHGKARAAVLGNLAAVARDLGLDRHPHAVLFSRRRFKQTGARYVRSEALAAHG